MKYCFFTPSYSGDLDRIVMLRQSIIHFVKEKIGHYIVVPKEDFNLFKNTFYNDKLVIILKQNDYVDQVFYSSNLYNFIKNFAPSQRWRISNQSGRPGWIIQQIVKLSIPNIIKEDVALIVDSDVFFIKRFSILDIAGASVNNRAIIRLHPDEESAMQREHIAKAREILGILSGNTSFHYMSWPVLYYKDWGESLLGYIQDKYKNPWQHVLYNTNIFSEYSIYGVYINEVLNPSKLHIIDKPFHMGIWSRDDFDKFISGQFIFDKDTFCIVVQSNLSIPAEDYKKQFQIFLEKSVI